MLAFYKVDHIEITSTWSNTSIDGCDLFRILLQKLGLRYQIQEQDLAVGQWWQTVFWGHSHSVIIFEKFLQHVQHYYMQSRIPYKYYNVTQVQIFSTSFLLLYTISRSVICPWWYFAFSSHFDINCGHFVQCITQIVIESIDHFVY